MKRKIAYGNFVFVILFCLVIMLGCGGGGGGGTNEPSATAQQLQNKSFTLASGEIFNENLKDQQTTLTFGSFNGKSGDFALVSQKGTVMGKVTLGSCIFTITLTTFLPDEGPQVGDQVIIRPCNLSDDGITLLMTNADSGAVAQAVLRILSDPPDFSKVAGRLTGDPRLAAVFVHENGERASVITETDAQGNVQVRGALWISSTGESVTVFLGNSGLPRRSVFSDGTVILYSNYTDHTVDLGIVSLNLTFRVVRDVPVDRLLLVKQLLEFGSDTVSLKASLKDLQRPITYEQLEDFARAGGLLITTGVCIADVVAGTHGVLASFACGSSFLGSLRAAFPEGEQINRTDEAFAFLGCATGASNIIECASTILTGFLGIFATASELHDVETQAREALLRPVLVTISSPQGGTVREVGDDVYFSGFTRYSGGGIVWGANFTWVSSINNRIGTTSSFFYNALSQGTHTITLSVADSEGRGGTSRITMTITPRTSGGENDPALIGTWKTLTVNGVPLQPAGVFVQWTFTATTVTVTSDLDCKDVIEYYAANGRITQGRTISQVGTECDPNPEESEGQSFPYAISGNRLTVTITDPELGPLTATYVFARI